ncbi:MAG: site-2 protease family protein [Dehalococcoidales bacterium]|nr:site-2 protease family protein [Dehalococcoidales bacterium]
MALNLGKIFGIQFRLHFTWFIIFIIVTVSLVSPNYFQWRYWVIGIAASLLFFASVVAHELAHSLVGRANGIPVRSLTLFIFGGVAQMTREVTRPGAEFKMAIAGPVCSLIIGGLFGMVWLLLDGITDLAMVIFWLAIMNGALAVFNLLPGFPLDGGRVLRSLLWHFTGSYRLSTRIATMTGQGVGYSLALGGILVIFLRPFGLLWFDGVWFILIGGFLARLASVSYRQMRWQEAAAQHQADSTLMPSEYSIIPRDNIAD